MRTVAAIAAATAGACMALSASLATVAQAANVDAAKVAAALASIIRRDAHEQLRSSPSAVTVTTRCCGVRVLRVHYGVKGTRPATQSSYVLRLESTASAVRGVAVFESAREVQLRAGVKVLESSSSFAFVIHRRGHTWLTAVSYEEISQGAEGLSGHPGGLGFAKACGLRSTLPDALYGEVLSTLERARHHRAFAPGYVGPSLCVAG